MALTNWLSRGEWSACYWLGMYEVNEKGAPGGDLGAVLRAGIGRLVREGYTFKGITADGEGNYEKVEMQHDAPHNALADMITGRFDPREYGVEAVAFCKEHVPKVDMAWLVDALEGKAPA